MDTWMKVTVAATVPALGFLVLNDTVQGFYGPSHQQPLAYSVIEEEEPAPEEEALVVDEDVAEETVAAEEAATEEVTQEVAVADEAPDEEAAEDVAAAEEVTPEDAPEDVAAAEEAAAEETADAVAATEEAPAAEEVVAAEEAGTEDTAADGVVMAMLTPEEMDAGEAAARACASCHQFERERNAAGPHLVGVDGRTIGSVDGFRYSRALQDLNAEGIAWNMENLQVWLENPDAFADGTRMMYAVQDPEERRLIAGWLTQREN